MKAAEDLRLSLRDFEGETVNASVVEVYPQEKRKVVNRDDNG